MGCSDSKLEGAEMGSPRETKSVDGTEEQKSEKPQEKPADEVSLSITSPRDGTEDFAEAALKEHNSFRSVHQVEPLTLSSELCELSERLCRQLIRTKTFCNSSPDEREFKGQECGENLYRYSGGKNEGVTPEMAVQSWYDEVDNYHSDLPGFDITTCHFTQMIWKGSKEMGIAHAHYDDDDGFRKFVVVAHYFPQGNIEGAYEDNVCIPEGFFDS